jgi:RimJ/RimL family protein N-acetyltransferase
MRRLTDALTLRHLAEPDIPERIQALRDPQVRRNISSLFALIDQGMLTKYFLDIVQGLDNSRLEFVLSKKDGTTVGYSYLRGMDLPGRTGRMGMIILPRYRFGYGLVAMLKTYEYAFGVLNMRGVTTEVYVDNRMMSTAETVTSRAQVTATATQFSEGEIHDSHFWIETRTEFPVRFGRYLQTRPEKMS